MYKRINRALKKAWDLIIQDMFQKQAQRCAEFIKQSAASDCSFQQLQKEADEFYKMFEMTYQNK